MDRAARPIPRSTPTPAIRASAAITCLLTLLLLTTPALADRALIVLSSDRNHYQQAANACLEQLRSTGHSATVVTVDTFASNPQINGYDAFIAVGGRSATYLAAGLPPAVPLYYCLAPPDALGQLSSRQRTAGIGAEVSFADQLTCLSEALPNATRLGVFYRSSSQGSTARLRDLTRSVPRGYEIVAVDLDTAPRGSEISGIRELLAQDIHAVWTLPDPDVYNQAVVKALLLESLRRRVPVFGFSAGAVRAGCLVGVGIDPASQGRRAAKLFSESSLNSHLSARPIRAINLAVSERFDIELPAPVRQNADVVFGM